MKPVTLEATQELFNMLTGGALPEGITMGSQPKLSPEQAFAVVWFLQEHMRIAPDHFERCEFCGTLFDDEREGHYTEETGHHFCGDCEHMDPTPPRCERC